VSNKNQLQKQILCLALFSFWKENRCGGSFVLAFVGAINEQINAFCPSLFILMKRGGLFLSLFSFQSSVFTSRKLGKKEPKQLYTNFV
jgi:hypothetical protein